MARPATAAGLRNSGFSARGITRAGAGEGQEGKATGRVAAMAALCFGTHSLHLIGGTQEPRHLQTPEQQAGM